MLLQLFLDNMYIKELKEAKEEIKKLPTSANKMFVVLSAANLLSACIKMGYIRKEYGYSLFKPTISKLISHCIVNPNMKLLEELYYDSVNRCAYLRCFGLQFSFHGITETKDIIEFASSDKNKAVGFDAIYKQPKALGLYRLSKECLDRNITASDYIMNQYNKLKWDFPELLTRHINSNNQNSAGDDVSLQAILGTKFNVKKMK